MSYEQFALFIRSGFQFHIVPVLFLHYIRQVNRVKLADIMFSLLCVCLCTLSPIGLNGRNDLPYCIQLMREKLRIFPYGQYIVGNILLAF